jgi:hypothetical protein
MNMHTRLYSDEGFDTVKSVYAKKLEELTALGTPLETRLYEAQNRGGKYYSCHKQRTVLTPFVITYV